MAFQLLVLAPKCLLGPLPRAGAKHAKQMTQLLSRRFARWDQGDMAALWSEALKGRSNKQYAPLKRKDLDTETLDIIEPHVARAVTRAVSEGAFSKGISQLTGESRLVQVNEHAVEILKTLHPAGEQLQPSGTTVDPFAGSELRVKQVLKALRSFKPLSAPGPSGLRASHLSEAFDVHTLEPKRALKEALLQWTLLTARGELPQWSGPWVAAARLIPLEKPGGGLRPVAVGEVLRRLTSKVLQHCLSSRLCDVLAPLQLGVGVKGASELIARKLRRLLRAEPGSFVLQVDLSNAFNSVKRGKIQEALQAQLPERLPWFELTHGQPSPLFCNEHVLSSQQGTQQGDPLGPAFFAVAIHSTITSTDVHGILWEAWYHDDGLLVGDEQAVLDSLAELTPRLESLGLKVNFKKCTLWSPQGMTQTQGSVLVSDWATAHVVLGTPFGSPEAEHQFLQRVHEKHKQLLHRLACFPDTQIALSLLRYCLGAQKVNHLLRVLWSDHMAEFVTMTSSAIRSTLETVRGRSLPESAWLQCCLPIRPGLGIQNPALTHAAAFVASALAEFSGASSPTGEEAPPCPELWPALESLSNQLSGNVTLAQWLSQRFLPPAAQIIERDYHSQRTWSEKVHLQLKQDLLASLPLRDQVRLRDESEEHAGGWLSVVPNDNLGSRFENGEFQLLIDFHLGLPVLPEAAAGLPCDLCGQPLDVYGDHLVTCRLSGVWKRHNRPRDTLYDISGCAGVKSAIEVEVRGRARPADLMLYDWEAGRDLAVDLTVRHPLAASCHWDPHNCFLAEAEAEKNRKYLTLCNQAGLDFAPVGLSTFGAVGPQGRCLLKKLFGRYAIRFGREQEERFPGQFQKQCW